MRKWKLFILLSICVLILLAGCTASQELDLSAGDVSESIKNSDPISVTADQVIRVGYCPTMAGNLSKLVIEGVIIEGFQYPSAAGAVQALQAGAVDAALIGRKPYAAEMDQGYVFDQLRDGVTLISAQQRMIPYAELVSVSIHTKLDLLHVDGLFPDGVRIVYYTEPVSVDLLDQNSAVLIDWAKVEGNDQLLIPVDEQGQKIPQFRTPFFVYAISNSANFQGLIASLSSALSD